MSHKRLREFIVLWLAFWVFAALAVLILAGSMLGGLLTTNSQLKAEHQLLVAQADELSASVIGLEHRLAAMEQSPQYAERIVRQQLNLRKAGEESLAVEPVGADSVDVEAARDGVSTLADRWWLAAFLSDRYRVWLAILGVGLLFAALVVSPGSSRSAAIGD